MNLALADSEIATYRALLALYPNDMRGLNNLADAYMDLKDFFRAESLFRRAIESDSSVGLYLRALGTTQIAEGRASEAVSTLRRSVELYYCPTCSLPDLARAFELTGAPDSAIAVYQRYVTTPWSEWQNAGGEFRVSSYERLGALREARGDTALAIAAYDKVASLWSDANVELQPLVANARRRAAALRVR
jgi:tetratricopeptide (TPR) repeat protein